ncbi:DDB1- and CUL4-associated factor 6 [Frankliniella fusca]|uniref:DDB1- and CUL4-associated factor 6 n=1 Tax=Frankliniella fusca TaxID=407009 RepID=A0AAE1LLA0_9NEOP|nr:DDB1- and CUL4-associated factor 6 [Frankliniella fusca]
MKRSKIYEKSLFHAAYNLPYDEMSRAKIYRSSKGDLAILQRMGLIKNLAVHSGCVNTISWNETGVYLLSGSDDQHLIISDAFSHKVVEDFKTSHRANIFSAKFLPCIRDSRIVSCSGDGILLFTDLMSSEPVYKSFNCHCGTAYEVATVPLDPHSFLSCGEDGTVRWYDLRTKDNCNKTNCQEDVMIQCQRAVTAMSVNMTAPFELAIGCSDSTVRLFDRRMLGTKSTGMTGKQAEPLCAFTVPSFKRAYRITSLCFAPEGEEILVSYSSDDLYLFSLRGKESTQLKSNSALCKKGKLKLSSSDPTPVRRLRLRGDWSDTGPDARPERETGGRGDIAQARPTLHTPLMQHLTNVISRLLNDPATRAALTSGVDEAGSLENSQETENASTPEEHSDTRRNDVAEESDDQRTASPRNNGPQVYEQPLQEYELFEAPGTSYDSFSSATISQNISALSEEENSECSESPANLCGPPSPPASQPQTEYKIAPLKDPEDQKDSNENGSIKLNQPSSASRQEEIQPEGRPDVLSAVCRNTERSSNIFNELESSEANISHYRDQLAASGVTEVDSESPTESSSSSGVVRQTDSQPSEMYAEAGIHEHDLDTLQSQLVDMRDGYIERHGVEPDVSLSYSHLGTNSSVIALHSDNGAEIDRAAEGEIHSTDETSPSLVVSEQSHLTDENPHQVPEPAPGPSTQNLGSSSDSDQGSMFDYDSEEDEQDLRRELRSRIAPPGLENLSSNGHEVPFPEIKQQYSGHRNASI